MLKKILITLALFATLVASSGSALALSLFVDSAPSAVNNSGDYDNWWIAAKSNIFGGTFKNMMNSANPANAGTKNFDIRDVVQYDFPDFGRQLNLIFWLPKQSVSTMAGNFELKIKVFDDMSNGFIFPWFEPVFWEDTNNGLIGTVGFAWDTSGIPAADLDNYIANLGSTQGDVIFKARRLDNDVSKQLRANYTPVPEPSTFLLLGAGLIGCGLLRRKKRS